MAPPKKLSLTVIIRNNLHSETRLLISVPLEQRKTLTVLNF